MRASSVRGPAVGPAGLLGRQDPQPGVVPGLRRPASRGPSQGPVVLVGCSAVKLSRAAPACELYVSELFKKARAYAEARGCQWAILSALHGLVLPDEVLEPYDCSFMRLRASGAPSVRAWAVKVGLRLDAVFPRARFVLLAGGDYRAAISHLPSSRREEPLAGLGIGQRLGWLKRQVEHMRGVTRG